MIQDELELHEFTNLHLATLDALSKEELDAISFGVVGLSPDGLVEIYNETESKMAGLSADVVIGEHFFTSTAQCMNNFMVAQRFEDEPELDAVVDYVLTFGMRPTPVRLRLLKGAATSRRYILIQR